MLPRWGGLKSCLLANWYMPGCLPHRMRLVFEVDTTRPERHHQTSRKKTYAALQRVTSPPGCAKSSTEHTALVARPDACWLKACRSKHLGGSLVVDAEFKRPLSCPIRSTVIDRNRSFLFLQTNTYLRVNGWPSPLCTLKYTSWRYLENISFLLDCIECVAAQLVRLTRVTRT